MKRIKDHSYGLIPIWRKDHKNKFLLIHMYGMDSGKSHWTFPKGHREEGESPVQTAVRETEEETGVSVDFVDQSQKFISTYDFIYKGVRVDKIVTYFICFVKKPYIKVQESEIIEANWYTYNDARERLTHSVTKKLLDDVIVYLEEQIVESKD